MKKEKKKLWDILKENGAKIFFTCLALLILCASTTALFFFTNIVRISDNKAEDVVMITTFSEKEKLLKLANVEVADSDKLLYTSYNGNYRDITIKHSFVVPITVDGTTTKATITEGNVANCLADAGIVLGEHDYTVPSLHTQIKEGDTIRVYRVQYVDNSYDQTIPYETTYKQSSLTFRFPKRQYTLSEGQNGTNRVTYRERYVDGELQLSLVSKVEVLKKPVNKVVLTYGKGVPVSNLSAPAGVTVTNGVPSGYSRVWTTSATGYYSARGRGASGLGLYYGTFAVDPNIIPYGTKVYIASPDGKFVYGWAIATDTGAAVTDGRVGIDLFYETYKESSLNWKNEVNVYIYG